MVPAIPTDMSLLRTITSAILLTPEVNVCEVTSLILPSVTVICNRALSLPYIASGASTVAVNPIPDPK
jgi:hypothetical protein